MLEKLRYNILDSNNKIMKYSILVFTVIISMILMASLILIPNFELPIYGRFISYIFRYIMVFIVLFSIIILAINTNFKLSYVKVHRGKFLLYSGICMSLWFVYWIAYYPGIMTIDSFNQWMQVHSRILYDWHPVPHTIFIYFITRIWDSPAAISLVQMSIFSFITGYVFYTMEGYGVNRRLLMLILILFALYPANGAMSIAIWKDLLYNSSIILITMFIMNTLITDGKWIEDKKNIAAFIITGIIFVLFRHNGLFAFIGTMILMLIIYRKKQLTFGVIFLSVILCYFIIKGPIYSFLNVKPGTPNEAYGIPTQQIAAVVANDGYLTDEQKYKINEIMPLKVMAENYHPYSVDLLKFHNDFNRDAIVNNQREFFKLWFEVCRQNPKIVFEAFSRQTSLVWQIREPYGRGYTYTINRKVVENDYNITNKTISPSITSLCNKILDYTEAKNHIWLFWRPALFLFIVLIFGFVAILKNGFKTIVLFTPVLLNNLTILMAIPAQDYRYLHANNLVAVIVFLFALMQIGNKKITHYN